MSLVHDALEKAKREASAKSARELGLSESRVGAGQPFRERRRLHPVAVAAIAVAITLAAVAGIAFWPKAKNEGPAANATPQRQTVPAARAALPEAAAPPPAPLAPVQESPSALAASSNPIAPATDAAAPAASAVPPVAAPPTPQASTASKPSHADPASTQASTPAAPTAPTSPKAPAASATSFVRQLTLGDGTVVRLGGIAWSEEAPLAYLNGKLYAKGESVAGMTIERIERDRVVLVGASGRVDLKLK